MIKMTETEQNDLWRQFCLSRQEREEKDNQIRRRSDKQSKNNKRGQDKV